MSKLYDMIRPNLSADVNWDYANYMTEHFPCRISGTGDDAKAAESKEEDEKKKDKETK